jgi:hypothetical protein
MPPRHTQKKYFSQFFLLKFSLVFFCCSNKWGEEKTHLTIMAGQQEGAYDMRELEAYWEKKEAERRARIPYDPPREYVACSSSLCEYLVQETIPMYELLNGNENAADAGGDGKRAVRTSICQAQGNS